MESDPIHLYNRSTGKLEREIVLGDKLIRMAYNTPARHCLSWPLFGTSCLSRFLGWCANQGFSRRRIEKTIENLHINMEDFQVPDGGFACFNDFFARRLRPGARPFSPTGFCSPADSRLLVYPELNEDTCIPVKGAAFTLEALLGEEGVPHLQDFMDGSLCIFRLCPADYHRFHFPDAGEILASWCIPGLYHSVNPIALHQGIRCFTENVRQISILSTKELGKIAFVEVGAFGVASITQTHCGEKFERGDEKGYFTFGGSTVIIVLGKNAVTYDEDILEHRKIECLVKAGEHIASSISANNLGT